MRRGHRRGVSFITQAAHSHGSGQKTRNLTAKPGRCALHVALVLGPVQARRSPPDGERNAGAERSRARASLGPVLSRRAFVASSGGLLLSPFLTQLAHAGIARGITVKELAEQSGRALFGTPLHAESRWETSGGRKRIVTWTRVRVEEALAGSGAAEVMVRTLGGKVGKVGQVVHGEALLIVGEPALLFLAPARQGVHNVTELGQGHYPIGRDKSGVRRLRSSPRVAEVFGDRTAAVRVLPGRSIARARELVQEAFRAAKK